MARLRVVEKTAMTIHLEVDTSGGTVEIMADFVWLADVQRLVFDKAHVEGAGIGALRRTGLNEVNVRWQSSVDTTGRKP